jgi:hypothetical protein
MSAQVSAVCHGGYYQLWQLSLLTKSMTDVASKTLIHAFITSQLDHCNGLYCGIYDGPMNSLQSVQNAAARLITSLGLWEHTIPVLWQLHGLPLCQHVQIVDKDDLVRSPFKRIAIVNISRRFHNANLILFGHF